MLLDQKWTEWLPIHTWAIEYSEGLIVVDKGEMAQTSGPGYFHSDTPTIALPYV